MALQRFPLERGEITNATVYARLGFVPRERAALESLSRIWGPDDLEVELALQKLGRPHFGMGGFEMADGPK